MVNARLRLLTLYKILWEQSDRNHILSMPQIMDSLGEFAAERKAIYKDLAELREFGVDIVTVKGNTSGYYINKRIFDARELYMIAEAVTSCESISEEDCSAILGKLTSLTDNYTADGLRRRFTIARRHRDIPA